ncbi:hypothetical protein F2P81_005110 [Scophthalmus maximus]|uniref:Uncharacterized protein n=1 Tax=Scophthalmus maximus TaxID=52904 RepID=A0A6A4TAY6_SCOMX|nr:hypothetical protein F2P81_005110 [Scophthalmus maximus]
MFLTDPDSVRNRFPWNVGPEAPRSHRVNLTQVSSSSVITVESLVMTTTETPVIHGAGSTVESLVMTTTETPVIHGAGAFLKTYYESQRKPSVNGQTTVSSVSSAVGLCHGTDFKR